MCLFVQAATARQDTSVKTDQSGKPSVTTETKSGDVMYVSGNDLVVKTDDGQVKHVKVPDDFKFQVDGKDLTVHELTPGMHLTRTITTTSVPKTVKTVRTISGKVWSVNAPKTVILTLPDNTNKQYNVPEGQKFEIDGQQKDVFSLRKGMQITATVITETPEVQQEVASKVTGEAPPPPPETPAPTGVLLIEVPASESAQAEQPAQPAQPTEVAKANLPQTASHLPLLAFLAVLCLCAPFLKQLSS
jgi:hypothetical protein